MIQRLLEFGRLLGKEVKQPERRVQVLVIASSGQRYWLDSELFHTRKGRDLSLFAPYEAKATTVAKRLLKRLCSEVDMKNCEMINFSNLGTRRTWHAVWFPETGEFDERAIAFDLKYARLTSDYFPEERVLQFYHRLCDNAVAQRERRLLSSAA